MDETTLPMDADTRHHPRVPGTAEVELFHAGGHVSCRARDVSLAGCYVETSSAPRGEKVELFFEVPGHSPGHSERIACAAEVLRKDRHSDGTLGLALRFLAVDWVALLGLARLVAPQLP